MSNYNSTLQSNNTDLQAILNTINELPNAGGEQATPVISVNNSNGLITAIAGTKSSTHQLAFQAAKTITPSTASQVAVSSGYYTGGAVTVAAIPSTYVKPSYTKTAATYTPTTTNQTISAGTYLTGTQTIKGDSNLIAGNIKSGVSIFGVSGNYEGSGGDTSVEDKIITRTISGIYTNSRVTSIGCNAFASCIRLTTVSFPVATSIETAAFANCTSLTTVSFPMATSIGTDAFRTCTKLSAVSFPKVLRIGQYAFYNCSKLTTVNFPSASTLGASAFRECKSLTTVSFPMAASIDTSAFYYCTSLTTVSFPMAISIGMGAFNNCTTLATINLPKATFIERYAFSKCYKLKSLYLSGSSICKLNASTAFSSTPIGGYSTSAGTYGSIYVPASLLASYKAATNWTYFSSRFVGV